ncbi:MAG: hypothetical protein KAR06_04895 [Deltaproteobacteria bacterium]|nr:hypothetical protein [Deltaproteobacteria bacterium]
MDTSETYMKMCNCKEIQGARPALPFSAKEWWIWNEYGDTVWLPRQDQLQEMVSDGDCAYDLFHRFEIWVNCYDAEISQLELSMEQLWLAFVMKEKYNKVWKGEEWCLTTYPGKK